MCGDGSIDGDGSVLSARLRLGPCKRGLATSCLELRPSQTLSARTAVKLTSHFEYIYILHIVKLGWKWCSDCGLRLGKAERWASSGPDVLRKRSKSGSDSSSDVI